MSPGFIDLAIIVLIAAVLGVVARMFRQPIVLAYLATGAIVAASGLLRFDDHETLQVFSELGVMFLLFLVGLEINYTALRLVGRTALAVGVSQAVLSFGAMFGIARLFGFPVADAAYIGAALSLSSTIIAVKFLGERRDTTSLYGRISMGVLLVQDVIAVVLLVTLGGLGANGGFSWWSAAITLIEAVLLFGLMLWLGRSVLPLVFHRVARSPELLFLVSLAWVFLLGAAVGAIGFPVEIAGFLAGLALANSSEQFQIAHRVRSLRDFFIVAFFVVLGSSFTLTNLHGIVLPVIVFSAAVLLFNPAIIFGSLMARRYRRRTSFFAALFFSEASEFGLVLAVVGLSTGQIGGQTASLITAVAIVTIAVSTYVIGHAPYLYRRTAPFLRLFERRDLREDGEDGGQIVRPFILVGANRVGRHIARYLPPEDTLVVEFDPEVVIGLERRAAAHILGDVTDPELFERINFAAAKLVISTSPDLDDNLTLLSHLAGLAPRPDGGRPRSIIRAESEEDAETLYAAGADYVLLPHFTSGQYLGKTISLDPEFRILDTLRENDLASIRGADPRS